MRCILFPSAVVDQVLCLPQRTMGVAAGKIRWVKLEPGSPFPRLQTPGSRPRLCPHTQAAARRWGSGSGVTRSPGCQVLYQPCSSYPVDLLHIHLASSTCQPFLVKSCKSPAIETQVTKEKYFQIAVPYELFFFSRPRVCCKVPRCYC